jgi:EAL domain-containing protein (putative c-di-GMP-specific phosphodiesterase class I)
MNVDPRDAAIVRTIVALAQTVGLTVVAEGIESEVVREQLRATGCDLGQGFLFGEGAPGESVAEFARSGRTALARLVALSA